MESHIYTAYSSNDSMIHNANAVDKIDDTKCTSAKGWKDQLSLLPSLFVVQLTVTASLGGCLFGYDMGAIAGTLPQLAKTFDLNDRQKELAVSILYVGGAIGACIGGGLCDRIGRKITIILTDVVFILGALLLYFASVYTEVVMGRFIVGVGVAVSGVADVSYLNECSPIEWRGSIVSVNEACISLGFLLAYIAGYFYADEGAQEWRVVFGVAAIPAAIQFIGMLVLPESPAWLAENGSVEDANRVLERINGTSHATNINGNGSGDEGTASHKATHLALRCRSTKNTICFRSNLIRKSQIGRINSKSPLRENCLGPGDSSSSIVKIIENSGGNESPAPFGAEPTGIKFCSFSGCNSVRPKLQGVKLTLSRYRRQVYIALFLAVTQQFCGQTNILSYAPLIFSEAMKQDFEDGDNGNNYHSNGREIKDTSMVIIGLVKFFVTILVIWRIEKVGRRSLLILGNLLIAAGLLALMIAFWGSSNAIILNDDNSDATSNQWSPFTNIKTFHLALPGVLLVVCGYSISFGPLTWLLTSELFPTAVKGRALGYSTIITYMCGALATETFLLTQSIIGSSFLFGIYCIVTICGVLFAYLAIPDTGGKTVEEIDESLNQMCWWKCDVDVIAETDEDCTHVEPLSSPRSEMVQNFRCTF